MPSLIEKPLVALLDKLPSGWKTVLGLGAQLTILLMLLLGYIDSETATPWFVGASTVTGVGIFHKATKD